MPTADNSYAVRTKLAQARAMASFKLQNPTVRDLQNTQFEPSALLTRKLGQIPIVLQPSGIVEQGCCCTAPSGTITISAVYGYDGEFDYYNLSWNTIANADTYTITATYPGLVFSNVTNTSARATFTEGSIGDVTFVITATNSCGSTTTSEQFEYPCFLAGSFVTLADGSEIPIENVKVGDVVVGAFGEHNPVLALHRPFLGAARMVSINEEHITSAHHPHIASNKSFYSADPARVYSSTYGKEHEVLNAEGVTEVRMLHGLAPGRVQQLVPGVVLKTIEGAREVKKIEELDFPSDTQLYNLVVGGSHTYHVEGYAVTGWPREDDFDYDNWVPK
jgi:hypothetical protein